MPTTFAQMVTSHCKYFSAHVLQHNINHCELRSKIRLTSASASAQYQSLRVAFEVAFGLTLHVLHALLNSQCSDLCASARLDR